MMKKSEKYKELFTEEYLMGPNCMVLLEEMLEYCPLKENSVVLDLGCGTGLTSFYLAKEANVKVFATDLWIQPTENARRIEKWGLTERMIPIYADANALPYAKEYFDALVSVDAYHYFGTIHGFFEEKILPFLKKNGVAIIAVPGIKKELRGELAETFFEWVGKDQKEYDSFRTVQWWRELLDGKEEYTVETSLEMNCCEQAWDEWFATAHPYAANDKIYYEKGMKEQLCFVGLVIRKK